MVMVMVMVFVVVMVMVMVIEDMCHFCFIWCESNIVENSLVPIWPDVAEFVFLTKLVMTKKITSKSSRARQSGKLQNLNYRR